MTVSSRKGGHNPEISQITERPPAPKPMNKIVQGLKEAVAGDIARVTVVQGCYTVPKLKKPNPPNPLSTKIVDYIDPMTFMGQITLSKVSIDALIDYVDAMPVEVVMHVEDVKHVDKHFAVFRKDAWYE